MWSEHDNFPFKFQVLINFPLGGSALALDEVISCAQPPEHSIIFRGFEASITRIPLTVLIGRIAIDVSTWSSVVISQRLEAESGRRKAQTTLLIVVLNHANTKVKG